MSIKYDQYINAAGSYDIWLLISTFDKWGVYKYNLVNILKIYLIWCYLSVIYIPLYYLL